MYNNVAERNIPYHCSYYNNIASLKDLFLLHHNSKLKVVNVYFLSHCLCMNTRSHVSSLHFSCIMCIQRLHFVHVQELDVRLNPVTHNEPDYRLFLVHMLIHLCKLGLYKDHA